MLRLLFLLSSLCTLVNAGEIRTWTSADGSRSFNAEFIGRSGDSITVLRENNQEATFDISKLHADDIKWLNQNHSGNKKPTVNPNFVFDTLAFGDDRTAVSTKLQKSSMLETSTDGIFLGRTGLNGVYRTRAKLGGLHCYLFFDWDPEGALKEITLHTQDQPKAAYDTLLKSCWAELVEVIQSIHGAPIRRGNMVSADSLKDGEILGSHLWKIPGQGSILLGTSKSESKYQVIVRFTTDNLIPNSK